MTIVEYSPDGRQGGVHGINNPAWEDVEKAVRQMDNFCYPIVILSCKDLKDNETGFDDENSFNIIGGDGRIALFYFMAEWEYTNNDGGEEEVRLWDSDQGYYCREKNILYDVEHALRIIKAYYETGSYETLNSVE